jgi:hypothetical protein
MTIPYRVHDSEYVYRGFGNVTSVMSSDRIREQHYYVNLFHISSKFEFFIGVDMFMCRALISHRRGQYQC